MPPFAGTKRIWALTVILSRESALCLASVSRDEVELMFSASTVIKDRISITCERRRLGRVHSHGSVKSFYEAVAGQVEIQMPLRQQVYGDWEFEVRDPNG